MRIFFDTEFLDDGHTIDLISIGAVRDDGAEYYAENADFVPSRATEWLTLNVIPHLRGPKKARHVIADDMLAFCGDDPEFWAYFAAYDWVAVCQLYGPMMAKPAAWPFYCLDLKQSVHMIGNPSLQRPEGGDHDALADARWNRAVWQMLRTKGAV